MRTQMSKQERREELSVAVAETNAALDARWKGKYRALIRHSVKAVDRIIIERYTEINGEKGGVVG